MPIAARALIAAAGLCAAAPAAQAEPLWELGVGVAGVSLPHYRGSDEEHRWLLPVPYFAYRGPILRASRGGARAVLFEDPRFEVDVSLAAGPPARSRDNIARAGMPDLDPTFEIGPNLNWHVIKGEDWKLDLRLPVRAVVALDSSPRQVGWQAAPNLNLDVRWQGWNLGAQAGPLFGDRRLHRYFYEVDPQFASASRPAYRARAGAAGWQATIAASRRFGNFWLGTYVRGDSVKAAAFDDSPLVRRNSHLSGGFALSWIFARSERTAPERE